MDFYDWLLFFHVAAAFALVAALIAYWAAVLATAGGDHPAAAAVTRPANVLVVVGSLLTLVFGIWLAIDNDAFEVWDGWIVASIVLWAIGVGTGQRSGVLFARAGEAADAPTMRQRAIVLHAVSSAAVLLVLVLMIFKPGA